MKDLKDIQFWHKVKLKDGTYTAGRKDIEESLENHLFNDLDFQGKSVLDTGCWDGAYSFLAEQRGASRVVSFDKSSGRWGGMDGYWFLHNHFNSKCEYREGDIYKLRQIFQAKEFDIVLCYGVLYHMSDPLLGMLNVFHVAKSTAVFEGVWSTSDQPILEFYTHNIINNNQKDTSVIYRPSIPFINLIAGYQGFTLRTKTGSGRISMIYDRVSEPTFQFPEKVFPPTG